MADLRRWIGVGALMAACYGPALRLGAADGHGKIQPADVFVRATQVREEIEQLRVELGKPVSVFQFEVRAASPREVYFQALTLLMKADRLAFEQLGRRTAPPARPSKPIAPQDVLTLVEAAQQRLRQVKEQLKIEQPVQAPPRDPTKTPTDVFRAIVQANRQLNVLLDQPFAPSDVYQQVQRASGLASVLASRLGDTEFPRQLPEFQRGKRPADVYRQLLTCLAKIQKIFAKSDLKILDIEVPDAMIDQVTPSDVYDLASVLVAELAYLHGRYPEVEPPPTIFYPGRKFPSHVHQAARLLDRQLDWLAEQVSQQPSWLKGEATP
ncbi:MAG: hypothetical protein GTO53_09980 [Planctomycetales bacterium]|nr:hypothetical protein [Planctomycetales bacterium]NIM09448.1 hypothetical protein [Planctomycetales bacterium]NIN08930.1 hypothetical protein [Planctomycetales bacterium]NIN78051.1 hypothetical protein [Planctomycetales bacterium]NIO35229.1 hypothetical protein [Planctomycetales bacterium]